MSLTYDQWASRSWTISETAVTVTDLGIDDILTFNTTLPGEVWISSVTCAHTLKKHLGLKWTRAYCSGSSTRAYGTTKNHPKQTPFTLVSWTDPVTKQEKLTCFVGPIPKGPWDFELSSDLGADDPSGDVIETSTVGGPCWTATGG
jgi:hypothetical protein